jgi:hypothetical protein
MGLDWVGGIAVVSPASMALVVMARKGYGEGLGTDYPNLAGKVRKFSVLSFQFSQCALDLHGC